MLRIHPYSPFLVNQVDADRVRRNLYEAGQGQAGINISAQITCAQSEAIVHQAAHEPVIGVEDKKAKRKST